MCRFYRFLIVFVAGIFAPVLYTSAYTAQTVQPVSGKTGFQTIVALHKHLRSMPDQHTQSAREQAKALIILIATGDMKDSSGKTVSFGVNPDPSLTTEAQRNEMIDAIHLTAATNHSLEYYLEALLDHPQKHFNVSHIRAVRYYFKDAPAFKLPPPPSFDLSKLPPPIFSDMTSSPSADSRPKFNPPSSFPGLPPPLNFGSTPPHTQQQSNAEEKPSPTVIPKRSQGFGNLLDEIKNRKHKSKKDNANAKKGNTSSSQPSQPMTHQSYDPDHPDAHSLDDFMAALGELLSNDGGQRVIDNLAEYKKESGLLEEEDDEWESVNLSDIKKLLLKKYFDYRKAPNPSKMGHAKAYFSGENFKGLEEIIKENNGVYSVEIGADKRYLDRKKAESRQKILDEAIERKRLEQEKKDREALEKQEIDDLEVRLNQKIVWADTLTPEEKIESFCQLSNPSYTPKYADLVKNMIMVKNADIKEVPVQIFVIARDEYKITSGNKPLLSYKFEDPTNKTYYDAIASIPGVKFRLYCMDNNAGIVILRITYDNSRIENRKDSFVILKEGNSGITPVEFEKIKDVILKFEK